MNCMVTRKEDCFYYFDRTVTTSSLRQFLLEKKIRLKNSIDRREVSDDKVDVARRYIRKIEDILRTEYFETSELKVRVTELMTRLKKDDIYFKAEIESLRKKLLSMEQCLRDSRTANHNGYMIPDESEFLEKSIMEYKMEIECVRDEMNAYEFRLILCRDLKGIICRPNGFFDAVYKIKA